MNMDNATNVSELKTLPSIEYRPSDVLIKRVDSDQSFLEIQKSELEQIKDNILKSLIDLRSEVYHDEDEKVERQSIIDKKEATISSLEAKIFRLELECQRISKERLAAAKAVESEREKLHQEVVDLLDYRQKMIERRLIRELAYDIAVPNEMMNFKKIENLIEEHQRRIERLERMKIGQSPSKIELINKQIAELEMQFNEELDKINFQCDELGRKYYYDSSGTKKFVNEFRVLMDEIGDYYLDVNGNRTYVREYKYDENGRYYLDDDNNRIYKATPYSPECRLLNGVLVRIKDKSEDTSQTSIYEESHEESEHNLIASKSAYLKFLMDNYAKQLKMALLDIAWKHPIDPVDHLQKYLSNYDKKQVLISIDEVFFNTLEQKRRIIVRQIFDGELK